MRLRLYPQGSAALWAQPQSLVGGSGLTPPARGAGAGVLCHGLSSLGLGLGRDGMGWFPCSIVVLVLLDGCADMEFLEVLTEHLDRVLLVRGGGREVITIYS